MAKNKSGRPEWFKFWRRNRLQLDIDLLSMESRGKIFTNMMRYFDGGEAELMPMTGVEQMAFNVLKINMDDSFSEYLARAEKNRENGRKGGRPPITDDNPKNPVGYKKPEDRRQKTDERIQSTEERVQSTDDHRSIEAGKPPRAKRFVPPTVEEVETYCRDRKNSVDAQRLYDYYTANGWVQGKGKPIKDWKAVVRTWERGAGSDIRTPDKYTFSKGESL